MMEKKIGLEVVRCIKAALDRGEDATFVPLHEPCFKGNESKFIQECLASTFVSSVGKYVDEFEVALSNYTGAKHAIAVVNGTAALHISLLLAGVLPNDEVIIPSLTFVATANAVSYCGAIPHFVDVNDRTLGMDADALKDWLRFIGIQRDGVLVNKESGRVIRAIVPMHTFGHPCEMDLILEVARDFNLAVVEDSAESLGSKYCGQHTGTFGLLGVLSFNGNKIITTGGGGAILTNNHELALKAKHLTTTAKLSHAWSYRHDQIGYNYRMPNLNAALGCAQLEQVNEFLKAKCALVERYRLAFQDMRDIKVFKQPKNANSNYWLQTLILDELIADSRNEILHATNNSGIMTRPAWDLLHRLDHFSACPRSELSVSESLERRIINVPSSAGLI